MKIEEQVLSIEQMKHLQELGVDTSDASMIWVVNKENPSIVSIDVNDPLPYVGNCACDFIPTYTIGDLIEKLPKHFYIKESPINICAINRSGAFQVWYDKVPKSCKSDGTIKNALYKLLCWVAGNHKELLEVKK